MASGIDGESVNDQRDGGIVDGTNGSGDGGVAADNGAADPAAGIAPKRGRGRPRKDGGPNAAAGNTAAGTGAPKKASVAVDVDLFAQQLMGAHLIAATLFKTPEIAIGEPEAKQLAKAIKGMMAQYSINVSPKTVAMMQLMGTAGAIYAPRAIMVAKRKQAEKTAKNTMQKMVTPVPPQGTGVPDAFAEPPPPQGSMKYN